MMIVQLAIVWYIAGSMLFLQRGIFNLEWTNWDWYYFMWAASSDVLFAWSVFVLMPKQHRWLLIPVFAYLIIKLIWEIIRPLTNWDYTHPKTVMIAFTILLTGVIALFINHLRKK